jgi:hypothetical protein
MDFVSSDQPLSTTLAGPSTNDASTNTLTRDSAAIKRLMEEVRCEDMSISTPTAYNRSHNRHNR